MLEHRHTRIEVREPTQAGEARRAAAAIAAAAGLGEADAGRVTIIASELATNLARHATGGEMLLRLFRSGTSAGVEILALDRGPGMTDVNRCLADGFSTGGTAGTGLGAVRRMSDLFEIHSIAPGGTAILSRVGGEAAAAQAAGQTAWGVVCVPMHGETECGDGWRLAEQEGQIAILVADGLGHGPQAAEASTAAAQVFDAEPFADPAALLDRAHPLLRSTRGAAVSIARINTDAATIRYAGVGNVSGSLLMPSERRGLMSHNGTVGLQMRKAHALDYECRAGGLLVMFSDGIVSRWSLDPYPGLPLRHPALISGVIYRDFSRGRDDTTVLVLRLKAGV